MKIIVTAALAGSFLVSMTTGAIGGPLSLPHSNLTAEPEASFELAHYGRHHHYHYRHYRRHHHHHHHHHNYTWWGPRIFSVAYEWRCNPLYNTSCFYPGPYYRFPDFYQ